MSYLAIDQLTNDITFGGRARACAVQEAQRVQNDQRPAWVALALDQLRGGGATTLAFVRLIAAFPGIVEDTGDEERFDQSRVTDPVILAQVQGQWETVAGLFWDEEGNRLP